MKPEFAQSISHVVIFLGTLLAAAGVYGNYYFGNKVEINNQSEEGKIHRQNTENIISKDDENTEKVLIAIDGVKSTVDENAEAEGANIKEISYPKSGEYGLNILDEEKEIYEIGELSMVALIPKKQKLKVHIIGDGAVWQFSLFQPIGGWKNSNPIMVNDTFSREFNNIKTGIVDFNFWFSKKGEVEIVVFENEAKEPTWRKKITIIDGSSNIN